jgi:tetratricopeptide (TPR) repeat protein
MINDTQTLARQVGEALERRDRGLFVTLVRQLIAAAPAMRTGYLSLAGPLLDYGERSLAKAAIDLHVAANDGDVAARFQQVLIYTRAVGPRAAFDLLRRLPPNYPDPVGRAYLEGTIALNLGEGERAAAALLKALNARPGSGQIYQSLSALGSLAHLPKAANAIRGAEAAMSRAPAVEQGPYLYALGKLHAEFGDHRAAFDAFARGAAMVAQARPYQAQTDAAIAAAGIEGWDASHIERIGARIAVPTNRPLFVTGLPRSGTTLVEHILTSHSAVSDGEELGLFGLVAGEVGGLGSQALSKWGRPPGDAAGLYLDLFGQRFPAPARAVDKSLEASRYMGLLSSLMPQAPIVWLRRDPTDNAWSAFRTYFLRGVDWSWSLEDIADHMRLEDRLFAHWRGVLGDRILVVNYEELVSDSAAQIARIMGHCGLPMEEATLTPERNRRAVTTNSVAQVRQPISTRSIGAADPYRPFLGRFVDRYRA